jgi:large subunit ribosomal protein L10
MAHVSDTKKNVVGEFVKLIQEYPIVGAIDIEGMPTAQLQKMRAVLRDNGIVLLMSKRRLMKIAIEQAKDNKKGIEELSQYLQGMPALIFSKENPFKLCKLLKQSKSEAPAKGGQIAPKDIEVKAGVTSFLPGPIISELALVGIKSGVQDGKVAIKEDSVVCKEGDTISQKLAELLTRLNVKPMEIGLNLIACFENGTIFKQSVLDVDEEKYVSDITKLASEAFNLSVEIGYLTKDNVELVIQNIFCNCKAVAMESGFMADLVVDDMLAKAENSAKSLQAQAKIEIPDKKVETKSEEKPKEEVKAEEKPKEDPKTNVEKVEEKEAEVLEEEKEIIKEEQKLEESAKEETDPEKKEVKEALKEEEEKKLENERIDKEKQVENLEKEKHTDDKVAKMVEAQKKHATGQDKKESAEELVKEAKNEKEIKQVEELVSDLQKGKTLKPNINGDKVPSATELVNRQK